MIEGNTVRAYEETPVFELKPKPYETSDPHLPSERGVWDGDSVEFLPVEHIDLDDYIPLAPEIQFIRDQTHLSRSEKEFHMAESAGRLIDEHVLRLPFSRTAGRLRENGHLEYVGVDMTESIRGVAERSEVGSRVWNEWKGYESVGQALSDGANTTILFSPPKDGLGHSFTFVTLKGPLAGPMAGPNSLAQLNIRHNGELHDPKRLQKTYLSLEQYLQVKQPKGFALSESDDILRTPIAATIETQEQLMGVLERLGIQQADVEKSLFRQRQMEESLKPMVKRFADVSVDASHNLGSGDIEKARLIRRALYNKAEFLWGRKPPQPETTVKRTFDDEVVYFASFDARVRADEADCVGQGLGSSDIATLLRSGATPGEIFSGVRILMCEKCPLCKREKVRAVIVGGRIHCPHCKASVKYDC